jgi:hypothetical protein
MRPIPGRLVLAVLTLAVLTTIAASALAQPSPIAGSARTRFVVSHCDYHTGQGCPPTPSPNSCHLAGVSQDPRCTPGALNPAVKQSTIGKTICKSGWTSTVRPPTSYTTPIKVADMKAYGFGGQSTSGFEFDHLISLELGGAPADIRNLWPENHSNSYKKDSLENSLKRQVCAGDLTLARAQRQVVSWAKRIG